MAQQLKQQVRQRMLAAAEMEFARHGYAGAKMAAIAEGAGVSAGNLYRYFANKDALFYALFTDEFAATFLRTLSRRVGSLVAADHLEQLDDDAQRDAEELLRFWIDNRLKVVVLLDRAAGSRYEGFAGEFVDALMKPTLGAMREAVGGARLRPVVRATLQRIFENTVQTIVSILSRHDREPAIREAFAAFWSYQLAGLEGFRQWVMT